MKLITALSLLAVLAGPSLAVAQPQYYFRRPEPKEQKSRISISGQVLFGINAELSNLGTVGYSSLGAGSDVLIFNDGYVVPGSGDLTTDFGFMMDNARVDLDGYVTSFDLTRYRSETLGVGLESDFKDSFGWEFAYAYQWGKRADRFRLGIQAGISLNRLEFQSDTTVEGRYIVQTGTFFVPGQTISHQPGGRYEGSPTGGGAAINPAVDLVESEVIEPIWGGDDIVVPSQVRNVFSIDGIMVNLRVGPTLTWRISNSFDAELSAGLIGVYYNSEATMRKNLLNLPVNDSFFDTTSGTRFERGTDSDFLYGFYGEGLLRYRATERVSFYSSVVYMSLKDPDSSALEGTEYRVSFDSPMMATAGMSVQF